MHDDNGVAATIGGVPDYLVTGSSNIMMRFSSAGPVRSTNAIKPDIVAPGGHILSAVLSKDCDEPPCFAFKDGTSMACPHVSGAVAVLRAQVCPCASIFVFFFFSVFFFFLVAPRMDTCADSLGSSESRQSNCVEELANSGTRE